MSRKRVLKTAQCVLVSLLCSVPALSAGKVVIAQVYGGGGSGNATTFSVYASDFIVLMNAGDAPVDISGWSIQYQGATNSGTPSESNRTNIAAGVIQPGQYFLVQQGASGTAAGTPALPVTPDVVGNIGMSNNNGKVFLVSNQTPITTGGTPLAVTANGEAIVDQVGYGTANLAEGGAATPALTRFTSVFRKGAGYQDTDNNAADFVVGPASALNSATSAVRFPAAAPVNSAPTVLNGAVYFGAADGKVYGLNAATNEPLPGFPFDARANGAGATAAVLGRVSLRVVNSVPYLFFVTSDAVAFCVGLDGTELWSAGPLFAGATDVSTTPAVFQTADASVENGVRDYVFVAAGSGAAGSAAVFKLRADTGALVRQSVPLGSDIKSSPAVASNNVFVGVSGGENGVARLEPVTLTVLSNLAPGQSSSGSPFIAAGSNTPFAFPVAFVPTDNGQLVAQNAITGLDVANFPVTVETGAALSSPFAFGGQVYVGSSTNKLHRVAINTGAASVMYDASTPPAGGGAAPAGSGVSTPGAVAGGVSIDPPAAGGPGAVVFASTNGFLYQIPLDVNTAIPSTARAFGTPLGATPGFLTAPAVDVSLARADANGVPTPAVAVGANDGFLYRFSRH